MVRRIRRIAAATSSSGVRRAGVKTISCENPSGLGLCRYEKERVGGVDINRGSTFGSDTMRDVFVVSRKQGAEWSPLSVHDSYDKARAKVEGLVSTGAGRPNDYRIDRVSRE